MVGIIAEFNPFHDGHQYIISRAKELCSADYVVIAMSGDFVQRGAPAIFSKYDRAEAALNRGADLVLQIPVMFSTASAEDFAAAGVALLAETGIVDTLVFGSESGNMEMLETAAVFLCDEPPAFQQRMREALRTGMSFPLARLEILKEMGVADVLKANDILGIEYLKALRRQQRAMDVKLVPRAPELGSAHAARADYYAGLRRAEKKPVHIDDFSGMLSYKLLGLKAAGSDLSAYQDVSEEIGNRIMAAAERPMSFTQRIEAGKTRQYTYTRIARCLIHVLLEIRKEDVLDMREKGYIDHLRVLGFRRGAGELVRAVARAKAREACPFITSPTEGKEKNVSANISFKTDLFAANVYNAVQGDFHSEYTRKLLTTVL